MQKKSFKFSLIKDLISPDNINSRKHLKLLITWGITIITILLLIKYAYTQKELFTTLLNISPLHVFLLVVTCCALFVPSGLSRKYMAQKLGYKLVFLDWYGFLMVSNLISLFLPARGDYVVSALYYKQRYGIAITQFAAMIYANAIISATILCLQAVIALSLIGFVEKIWPINLWVFILLLTITACALAVFPYQRFGGDYWISKVGKKVIIGWQTIRSDTLLTLKLMLLCLSNTLIFIIWMYFSFRYLGFNVSLFQICFASAIIQLSYFASLTPGNLGVREAIAGIVSQLIGIGFTEGLVVTLLQRAVSMCVFIILGVVFAGILAYDFQHKGLV